MQFPLNSYYLIPVMKLSQFICNKIRWITKEPLSLTSSETDAKDCRFRFTVNHQWLQYLLKVVTLIGCRFFNMTTIDLICTRNVKVL